MSKGRRCDVVLEIHDARVSFLNNAPAAYRLGIISAGFIHSVTCDRSLWPTEGGAFSSSFWLSCKPHFSLVVSMDMFFAVFLNSKMRYQYQVAIHGCLNCWQENPVSWCLTRLTLQMTIVLKSVKLLVAIHIVDALNGTYFWYTLFSGEFPWEEGDHSRGSLKP